MGPVGAGCVFPGLSCRISDKCEYFCGKQPKAMALNTEKKPKLYYSIKEVSDMLGVTPSMLRFWEKEIPQIKPKTTGNNVRQYTQANIEDIKTVYNLVKVRGFKLAAAKRILRENKCGADTQARVIEELMGIREGLQEIKRSLDAIS